VKSAILIVGDRLSDSSVQLSLKSARLARSAGTQIVVATREGFSPDDEWRTCRHNPHVLAIAAPPEGALARIDCDYVLTIDAGAEINPEAVQFLDNSFTNPLIDVVYGDSEGQRLPAWSPYRFVDGPYFGEAVAFRPTALAAISVGHTVAHVPAVLARGAHKPCSLMALLQKSLMHHAVNSRGGRPTSCASIVIPTNGSVLATDGASRPMILGLLESLMPLDPRVDGIIVVADTTTPSSLVTEIVSFDRVSVLPYDKPFNFSDKCNVGAVAVDSDALVFLNDDMVALTSDWLGVILQYLSDSAVGAVGGLLVSPNGLVQCAGHANVPVPHIYGVGLDPDDPQNREAVGRPREASGLSGACFAMRRDDFLKVGGMCLALGNSYNDVDLGFKLMNHGLNLVYTSEFRFIHYESASRDPRVEDADIELVRARWGRWLERDPFPV
jgi:GT2 family glycosyltransferase